MASANPIVANRECKNPIHAGRVVQCVDRTAAPKTCFNIEKAQGKSPRLTALRGGERSEASRERSVVFVLWFFDFEFVCDLFFVILS